MTRFEMIQFIEKYGKSKYDFTRYDDNDLIKLCGRVSRYSDDARKEFNESMPFTWYANLLDSLLKKNNIWVDIYWWILILFFNPIFLVMYIAFGIIGIIALIFQLTN